jgi:hypothetical protein
LKSISRLFLVLTLGLLTLGITLRVYPWRSHSQGLQVLDPDRDVGPQIVDSSVQLDYVITNVSYRPLRILGFSGG